MKKYIFAMVALVVLLIASMSANLALWQLSKGGVAEKSEKVKVTIKKDKVTKPEPVAEKMVGAVSVPVKVSKGARHEKDTCEAGILEKKAADSLSLSDDGTVEVPITQKVYADSGYVAYVSGYEAKLDSIILLSMTTERTVTETKVKKPPRLRFGIGAGAVCGLKSGQVEPGLFAGIIYTF